MANLMEFVYATMYKRINNPKSRFWLPRILSGIHGPDGGSLMPLTSVGWQLGQVKGGQGAAVGKLIADQWWLILGSAFDDLADEKRELESKGKPLPDRLKDLPESLGPWDRQRDKDAPFPELEFKDVEVWGLPNAKIGPLTGLTATPTGYQGAVRITVGAYDDGTWQPRITIKSRYHLKQSVVAIDKPSAESAQLLPKTTRMITGLKEQGWPGKVIDGTGTLQVTVTDLVLDAVVAVSVTGTGAGRRPAIVIKSVAIASQPVLKVDKKDIAVDGAEDPDLVSSWKQAAADAVNSKDAAGQVAANISQALTGQDMRDQLSRTVTQQLEQALDQVLGTVPAGRLPGDGSGSAGYGPVEHYLFDRTRASLNDPASPLYPPAIAFSLKDPSVDPYRTRQIDLGSLQIMGIRMERVLLNDITVTGLPNVIAPAEDTELVSKGVDTVLRFSTLKERRKVKLPPGSQPSEKQVPDGDVVLSGSFQATFPNDDGSSGTAQDQLTGTFTVTAKSAAVRAGLSFTGDDADAVEIGLRALTLELTQNNLDIDVECGKQFRDAVRKAFNGDTVKTTILAGVQAQMEGHRSQIAGGLTTAARAIVKGNLT